MNKYLKRVVVVMSVLTIGIYGSLICMAGTNNRYLFTNKTFNLSTYTGIMSGVKNGSVSLQISTYRVSSPGYMQLRGSRKEGAVYKDESVEFVYIKGYEYRTTTWKDDLGGTYKFMISNASEYTDKCGRNHSGAATLEYGKVQNLY